MDWARGAYETSTSKSRKPLITPFSCKLLLEIIDYTQLLGVYTLMLGVEHP